MIIVESRIGQRLILQFAEAMVIRQLIFGTRKLSVGLRNRSSSPRPGFQPAIFRSTLPRVSCKGPPRLYTGDNNLYRGGIFTQVKREFLLLSSLFMTVFAIEHFSLTSHVLRDVPHISGDAERLHCRWGPEEPVN